MADTATAASATVPKPKGNRLRHGVIGAKGRTTGSKNKTTLVKEMLGGKQVLDQIEDGIPALGLNPFVYRVVALLKHRNGFIRLGTEKFLYEALHGKPKQQTDVNVNVKDPNNLLRRAAEAAAAMNEGAIEATIVDARLLEAPKGNGNGSNHK